MNTEREPSGGELLERYQQAFGAAMDEVLRTWLRFDDVECVRCSRWAGPEGDTVYVVGDEGTVCAECVTEDEQARATQ